jgi:hypothetical protein
VTWPTAATAPIASERTILDVERQTGFLDDALLGEHELDEPTSAGQVSSLGGGGMQHESRAAAIQHERLVSRHGGTDARWQRAFGLKTPVLPIPRKRLKRFGVRRGLSQRSS